MFSTILVLVGSLLTTTCADDRLAWDPAPRASWYLVLQDGTPLGETTMNEYPLGCRDSPVTICIVAGDAYGNEGRPVCVVWEAGSAWDLVEDTRDCAVDSSLCCREHPGVLAPGVCTYVTDAMDPRSPCCAPPIGTRATWP